MRYLRARSILAVACCLLLAVEVAVGQQVEQSTSPADRTSSEPASETGPERAAPGPTAPVPVEFKPEMILLEDPETGQLKQLIGFSLQDFEELNNLKAQREGLKRPPQYSLQSLRIEGTGQMDHVELTIQIVVLVNENGWVKVPLRLNEASLVNRPRHEGQGKFFLETGDGSGLPGGGLIAWIDNHGGSPRDLPTSHELSLDVLVPLDHVAGENRLKLSLPAAPESSLRMTVPTPQAVAIGSDGLARVQSRALNDQQTEFIGTGLKPDFELNWRMAAGRTEQRSGVFEAICEVLVRMDGRGVHSLAELKLRNSAMAFSHFRVRLPPGAELMSGDEPGYTIETVSPVGDDGRAVVEVRIFEPNTTASVRLVTERSITQQDESIELAGFDVLDAVRQWGRIAVAVDDRWQAAWGSRSLVRQVETLPASLERDDLAARFEYSGQPYSLTAQVVPRQTYVAAQPHYRVDVLADHLELEARVQFTVRRAKAFQVQIDLADWQLLEDGQAVGPDSLVDVDQVIPTRTRPLIIPLKRPTSGPFEVVIRARREIAPGKQSLSFDLPRPDGDYVGAGLLRVQPAANIDLTPVESMHQGLARQPLRGNGSVSENMSAAFDYVCDGPAPKFAADFDIRAQTITASTSSLVRLDQQESRVEQSLVYDVAHQPAEELSLLVPREIVDSKAFESLRVTLGGEPLTLLLVDEDASPLTDPLRYRVALPGGQIGRFSINLSFSTDSIAVPVEASVLWDVPLVMPADGRIIRNELTISAPAGVTIFGKPGSRWRPADDVSPNSATPDGMRLSCAERSVNVPLVLQAATRWAGATVVDRTWIQTQLMQGQRHDRVVYRFKTPRPRVSIELPAGVVAGAIKATLDGQAVDVQMTADRLLEFSVPPSGVNDRSHVLELEYRCDAGNAARGQLRLNAPRWIDETWLHRTYWQLVLPSNQHIVWGPADYVHEFTWQWRNFHWARSPVLAQQQLESWSGGSAGGFVARRSNRYLFSRLDGGDELRVQTAGRSMVVLFSSAAALIAGLVLLYVPACRRPVSLLITAVVLLGAGAAFPEPAIVCAQAGGLGAALAVVALASDRLVARRRGTGMMIQGSSGSIRGLGQNMGSTRRHVAAPVAGSNSSTKATALSLPATSESKS